MTFGHYVTVKPSEVDHQIEEERRAAKRSICLTIEEQIQRLKSNDFYSINDDEYVCVGRNSQIHKDDYIKALEDIKFKIMTEGNWVDDKILLLK